MEHVSIPQHATKLLRRGDDTPFPPLSWHAFSLTTPQAFWRLACSTLMRAFSSFPSARSFAISFFMILTDFTAVIQRHSTHRTLASSHGYSFCLFHNPAYWEVEVLKDKKAVTMMLQVSEHLHAREAMATRNAFIILYETRDRFPGGLMPVVKQDLLWLVFLLMRRLSLVMLILRKGFVWRFGRRRSGRVLFKAFSNINE